ncbi:hypothetical protein TNCT_249101 [Trichonephila clavata]|uniref:Uncharacterized protein n=1 Tax=Trichonephila clavata TaxID=2740835 RepID=A0A8X6F3C0_TRICU|nr:hypothetical protein TNCT_249101 [Trichonephila clavata]
MYKNSAFRISPTYVRAIDSTDPQNGWEKIIDGEADNLRPTIYAKTIAMNCEEGKSIESILSIFRIGIFCGMPAEGTVSVVASI